MRALPLLCSVVLFACAAPERNDPRLIEPGILREVVDVTAPPPPPNPLTGGATPPGAPGPIVIRYRVDTDRAAPRPARAIVVLMPGFLGGAGSFDSLARAIGRRSTAEAPLEAWAVDRRSNWLEDREGLEAAITSRDPNQLAEGKPVNETLGTATHAVKRASTLTRQLLAYAGRSKLAHAPTDLNRLVETMGELLALSVSRKVKLERVLAPQLPAVMADEGQLQQVVMNLITNASEAIGDRDGVITLRTELVELAEPPPDVVGIAPVGRVVKLVVSDTGQGMAPEVKARIFDPFFSTKGSGRGLGLAALLGILRSHGGAIGLTTEPGRGSTFTVYLPALGALAPVSQPGAKPEQVAPLNARVLLVDDEEMIRRTARRLLQSFGCTVEEARTGVEAVAKVTANPAAFDVVLMDLTMPEMDGYEATRRLAVIAPSLPVVLSSGYSAADDAGPLPAGVRSLAKPYDRQTLERLMREVLRLRG